MVKILKQRVLNIYLKRKKKDLICFRKKLSTRNEFGN